MNSDEEPAAGAHDAAFEQAWDPMPGNPSGGPRKMVELDRDEALRLLGSVSVGRVVFTEHALPAIRPVNHIVDGTGVIIRTRGGTAITTMASRNVVVAYEADLIDPLERLGWSVIVTGYAQLVRDPAEIARYELLVHPWAERPDMDHIVRIGTDLVTGFVLVRGS